MPSLCFGIITKISTEAGAELAEREFLLSFTQIRLYTRVSPALKVAAVASVMVAADAAPPLPRRKAGFDRLGIPKKTEQNGRSFPLF
jgi:hypothetical protein